LSIQNPLGPRPGGNASLLDITTATVVKASPGILYAINVLVAGSAVGAVYDASLTSGNTIANQIAVIPDVVTTEPLLYTWPCATGIVIAPGTGQTLSVSFA
jgi:hypothetical protein